MDPEPYIADARISAVVENLANPERFFMSGCAKLREKSWETRLMAMPCLRPSVCADDIYENIGTLTSPGHQLPSKFTNGSNFQAIAKAGPVAAIDIRDRAGET
jgi:hypothetical protein